MSSSTAASPIPTDEKKSSSGEDAPPYVAEEKPTSPAAELAASAPTNGTGQEPKSPAAGHTRTTTGEESLTPKQKVKLAKSELQELKRQSTILKTEAKEQKKALATSEKELTGLQKIHSTAVKNEAKGNAKHTKVLREFQKIEAAFLATRTKFEAAQARLHSEDETVEIVRKNTKEASETLQEKTKEVAHLREQWSSDEKDRTIKLNELSNKGADHGCIIC